MICARFNNYNHYQQVIPSACRQFLVRAQSIATCLQANVFNTGTLVEIGLHADKFTNIKSYCHGVVNRSMCIAYVTGIVDARVCDSFKVYLPLFFLSTKASQRSHLLLGEGIRKRYR